jgi:hypothetical protein
MQKLVDALVDVWAGLNLRRSAQIISFDKSAEAV